MLCEHCESYHKIILFLNCFPTIGLAYRMFQEKRLTLHVELALNHEMRLFCLDDFFSKLKTII